MRILLSTRILGGSGGAERNAWAMIGALAQDDVDVCAAYRLPGNFVPSSRDFNLIPRYRWRPYSRVPGLSPLIRALSISAPEGKEYDLYIQLRSGPSLSGRTMARCKLLIPSGGSTHGLGTAFDAIAIQSPADRENADQSARTVLLPPVVTDLADASTPVEGVPPEFVLTVFNPWGPKKGLEDFRAIAPRLHLPVVWCMSNSSRADYTELRAIPTNVYVVRDPSLAQLRFLYERAASYLCTSRSEGFGWSVADALQYGLPVVSRRVGVLSYPQFDADPQVHFFVDAEDAPALINELTTDRVVRDMSAFSPHTFRNSLCALLDHAQ